MGSWQSTGFELEPGEDGTDIQAEGLQSRAICQLALMGRSGEVNDLCYIYIYIYIYML